MRPKLASAASTRSRAWAWSVTSARQTQTSAPSFLSSRPRASAPFRFFRQLTTTRAPARAAARASAAPSPWPAPVTRTVRPRSPSPSRSLSADTLLAGDADHLGHRRHAPEDLLHRRFLERAQALLPRRLEDLERAGLRGHEAADLLGHGQDLVDARPPHVAGLAAVQAALPALEAVGLQLLDRDLHGRGFLGRRLVLLDAVGAV